MTKRSSTTKKSSKQQTQMQRIAAIVAIVAVLLLAGLYLVTGKDPLGLFTPPEETAVVATPDSTGGGGDWWQVYFTDPARLSDPSNLRGSVPEQLISRINAAQESIHIASFEFNLTPVAEALIAAHKRGVEVLWVTDDEHGIEADEEDDHGQFAMLEKAGIEVVDDGRSALMHNKFWIFDGHTVWTGSTNITQNGGFRNNNNVIVIQSSRLAAIYEREFDEMWDGEFGPRSPSTVGQQSVTIDGTPVQALFAAEDEVVSELIPLVARAEKSIYFMSFSFTHDDLGDALIERARADIPVQGIFETRASETEYSEMPLFYCARIAVRQDGNPGTFHHKVLIVDEKVVVTGSLNFSANADDSNDENVLIITNADIAKLYLQEFEARWAEAREPEGISCR